MPMPLALDADKSDSGWSLVVDVLFFERFSRESGGGGSFGDPRVGAVASGRVWPLKDFIGCVAQAGGRTFTPWSSRSSPVGHGKRKLSARRSIDAALLLGGMSGLPDSRITFLPFVESSIK